MPCVAAPRTRWRWAARLLCGGFGRFWALRSVRTFRGFTGLSMIPRGLAGAAWCGTSGSVASGLCVFPCSMHAQQSVHCRSANERALPTHCGRPCSTTAPHTPPLSSHLAVWFPTCRWVRRRNRSTAASLGGGDSGLRPAQCHASFVAGCSSNNILLLLVPLFAPAAASETLSMVTELVATILRVGRTSVSHAARREAIQAIGRVGSWIVRAWRDLGANSRANGTDPPSPLPGRGSSEALPVAFAAERKADTLLRKPAVVEVKRGAAGGREKQSRRRERDRQRQGHRQRGRDDAMQLGTISRVRKDGPCARTHTHKFACSHVALPL